MNGQSLDQNLGKEFVGFDKNEDCQCSAEAINLGRNAAKKYKRETKTDTQVKGNNIEFVAMGKISGKKFVKGSYRNKRMINLGDVSPGKIISDSLMSDGSIATNDN